MDCVKTYKVTIYSDGHLYLEKMFDELWEAAQWMENYASSGQMWYKGTLAEIIDNNITTLYGF